MFAGGRRRSSNVRAMQLFHELKQQFPTVPDNVVQACIAKHAHGEVCAIKQEVLEVLHQQQQQQQQQQQTASPSMGRSPSSEPPPSPATTTPTSSPDRESGASSSPPIAATRERHRRIEDDNNTMRDGDDTSSSNSSTGSGGSSDPSQRNEPSAFYSKKHDLVSVSGVAEASPDRGALFAKRPDRLDIVRSHLPEGTAARANIQTSERCKDVHKLLNSDNVSEKPPRSPLSVKRFANISAKNSPTGVRSPLASPEPTRRLQNVPRTSPDGIELALLRRQTAETPTQTTDTLLGEGAANSVNLSLNVNCSMDVVQSPVTPRPTRRSSILNVTPEQPWLEPPPPTSPRSYTSVNLTLRPPSSDPQPPIDITSQNSSLTYSTSMFDSQKGLQSRLQITVGPTGGSVSSVRTRPRSSYHPPPGDQDVVPARTGSLPDLAANSSPPVIIKQQARLDRLRIELRTEKAKLITVQQEVMDLENGQCSILKTDIELEKQLQKEIRHLRFQCERLTHEIDRQHIESAASMRVTNEEFYRNIYTGQRGPLGRQPRTAGGRMQYQGPGLLPQLDAEGPKWNCHMCTFQNHPALSKCEQCEMPRILHVSAAPGDNIHIHVTPRISRRTIHSWVI